MKDVDQTDKDESLQEGGVHKFDAQSDKILSIVINSLYTDKGVVFRELVSNASDACEKFRYESLLRETVMDEGEELKILIKADTEQGVLRISDNGIGMGKQDMIENLGTIARSGTESFVKGLDSTKSDGEKLDLIGQFGVGFYSAFMLADRVTVCSRKFDGDGCWEWSSEGKGAFSIKPLPTGSVPRGTEVALYMKEDEKNFLDKFKIEHLVSTYSDHIGFPIFYINDKGEEEKLNEGAAVWRNSPGSVSVEQHNKFFQGVAHVGGEPWLTIHNHNEGAIEYINLLYIPCIKPFDLFHPDRKSAVKLYINKVFIAESSGDLIPAYLRFLRGIVDSADLPLNISRETLQSNSIMTKIKQGLIAKVMKELKKRLESDPEDYDKVFWKNFGAVLKEGLCEYMPTNERERLFEVCRFYSSKEQKLVSFDNYIARMRDGQEHIYYLSSSSVESAVSSPQMEGFFERDVEVLFFTDPVDNFWTNVNPDYKDKKFMSITRSESGLDKFDKKSADGDAEVQQDEAKVQSVTEYIKKILGDLISEVRVSSKLVGSPSCLAVVEGSMDIRMERFMLEQKQIQSKSSKILEINMSHPVLARLTDNLDTDCGADIARVLYYQACILEGEVLDDPVVFRDAVNRLVAV